VIFSNIPLSAAVTDWYASHAVVRHLWLIKQSRGVRVLLTLEPPVDGNDTHPAWIANRHVWTQDLQSRVEGSLHLELMDEPALARADFGATGTVVMEVCWRDPSVPEN
jgi:hypothetical protein